MRAHVTALLLLILPALAPAQTNLERVANDAYTRSHDYDLRHQLIEVWGFDWDSTSFEGRVTTTLVALRPGMDSIILDAGALLAIKQVTNPAGAKLRFATHGDTLVVFPAAPIRFGDSTRFTIAYHGRVTNGKGFTFISPEGQPHRPRQIWSQGEDMNSHYWFPTYDFPNDKMSWEIRATVGAEYTVVSNGRLLSDRKNADGRHTVSWRQDLPTATYLVSLIVAPLARVSDAWQGIPVDYYVYHEDSAIARHVFGATPDMIDVYSRLTGIRYPWAKYAQTTVADFFGGMENVSATTLVDWLPDARSFVDRPWYQWILIPHELAHQWFGDYTTTVNWANFWLNEGFAEFMPGQYWGTKLGPRVADDYYADEYDHFMQIDARKRMPLAAKASNNVYPKGALVLRMLERYLGPERFWASIHTYLTRHALGNATSDDLRQAVLIATGENLDWFWNEWVYQAGYPEFTVTSAYDSTTRDLTLTVKQTQVDSSKADSSGLRFTTPDVFRMPLAIRVGTSTGDVVRRVTINAREQTIKIDSLSGAPTMVVFDDGDAVLKTLNFDQPTSWLATQVARDPDLWNRAWAMKQLASRASLGDSAAAAALATAATSADYKRTRAEAAEALAATDPDIAVPALERALKDTASLVRESALEALGEVGGSAAVPLAWAAFHGDPSYSVQAAAVTALLHADPGSRDSVLKLGLATPSYQDVVRTAALRAIVQANDTSYLGRVEELFGVFRTPAHVCAALANRGSGHALDVLTAHLDDERSYVRRWVLQAFQNTLRPDLGLPRLRAAQDGLKHSDMRTKVGALIEKLAHPGL